MTEGLKVKLQQYKVEQNGKYRVKSLINLPIRDMQLLNWKKGDLIQIDTDVSKGEIKLSKLEGEE